MKKHSNAPFTILVAVIAFFAFRFLSSPRSGLGIINESICLCMRLFLSVSSSRCVRSHIFLSVAPFTVPRVNFSDAASLKQFRELSILGAQMAQHYPDHSDTLRVSDFHVDVGDGEILVRLYNPTVASNSQQQMRPLLIYYHGGGFALYDVPSFDIIVRQLAHLSGCVTLSVDYRLAPEHKFPAAFEDSYAALVWAAQHAAEWQADPNQIVVMGDSAGATISAEMALMTRDRHGPKLAGQGSLSSSLSLVVLSIVLLPAITYGTLRSADLSGCGAFGYVPL